MLTQNQQEELYKIAKKKARQKKLFFRHFGIFAIVCTFLFILNFLTIGNGDDWGDTLNWWFLFPTASWGMAIAIHYFSVFGIPLTNKVGTNEWEAKQVERELAKLQPASEQPLIQKETQTTAKSLDEHLELQEVPKAEVIKTPYDREDLV